MADTEFAGMFADVISQAGESFTLQMRRGPDPAARLPATAEASVEEDDPTEGVTAESDAPPLVPPLEPSHPLAYAPSAKGPRSHLVFSEIRKGKRELLLQDREVLLQLADMRQCCFASVRAHTLEVRPMLLPNVHAHPLWPDKRLEHSCDVKGARCTKTGTAYRCYKCDYDVCTACVEDNVSTPSGLRLDAPLESLGRWRVLAMHALFEQLRALLMQSAHALTAQVLLRASTSEQRHAVYDGYRDALENAGASELEGVGSAREALIHRLLIGSDPATTAHLASFVLSPRFTESAAQALHGSSTSADEGAACMLSLACTLMAGGVALPIGLGSRHLPLDSVMESLRVATTPTATLKDGELTCCAQLLSAPAIRTRASSQDAGAELDEICLTAATVSARQDAALFRLGAWLFVRCCATAPVAAPVVADKKVGIEAFQVLCARLGRSTRLKNLVAPLSNDDDCLLALRCMSEAIGVAGAAAGVCSLLGAEAPDKLPLTQLIIPAVDRKSCTRQDHTNILPTSVQALAAPILSLLANSWWGVGTLKDSGFLFDGLRDRKSELWFAAKALASVRAIHRGLAIPWHAARLGRSQSPLEMSPAASTIPVVPAASAVSALRTVELTGDAVEATAEVAGGAAGLRVAAATVEAVDAADAAAAADAEVAAAVEARAVPVPVAGLSQPAMQQEPQAMHQSTSAPELVEEPRPEGPGPSDHRSWTVRWQGGQRTTIQLRNGASEATVAVWGPASDPSWGTGLQVQAPAAGVSEATWFQWPDGTLQTLVSWDGHTATWQTNHRNEELSFVYWDLIGPPAAAPSTAREMTPDDDDEEDVPTCPHGHRMARQTGVPPLTYGPQTTVRCDGCNRMDLVESCGHFFHCPPCRHDLCPACAEPRMQRREWTEQNAQAKRAREEHPEHPEPRKRTREEREAARAERESHDTCVLCDGADAPPAWGCAYCIARVCYDCMENGDGIDWQCHECVDACRGCGTCDDCTRPGLLVRRFGDGEYLRPGRAESGAGR